jgi:Pvc16 N-terminal domain/Carboxypeptidase regulatory-like domain
MLISVLQTLAEILAGGTSLTSTEQIDFSRPGSRRDEGAGTLLNLYFYDIRESKQVQHSGRQVERKLSEGGLQTANVNWSPNWFDVSLLVTAWDRTTLGEHHLLSEALNLLLRYRSIQEEFLAPGLRGFGNLSLSVSATPPIELGALWSALSVPLRPALYLTVTVPFEAQSTSRPLVWERIMSLSSGPQKNGNGKILTRRVSIAGIIKSAVTSLPLAATEVSVTGIERSTQSNEEGLFFLDNIHPGNYVLTLNCPGYTSQHCNVLVDNQTYPFKEVLLTPD